MKKMVEKRLCGVIVIGMLLLLSLNYYLQIKMSQREMDAASRELFWQIDRILTENQRETETVKEEFQKSCLVKAKAAAYIVQNRPSILEDEKEIKKVAKLLQVDELHIFNTAGTIYAGSEPKYFGYNFNSGEQMQFFLPMLEDKNMELCQPVTPNTAEGKMMQYAAVWREDQKGIVQIGMEPERVLKATEKNELSYIFSLLTENSGTYLCAADPETYEILGSTNPALTGKRLTDIGLEETLFSKKKSFHAAVNGKFSYCIFTRQNGVLAGRICSAKTLYSKVNRNTLLLAGFLLVISTTMIFSISRYLDKNIISSIDAVNYKLQNIINGNLDEKVEVGTTAEFEKLSDHINRMIKSLLDAADKLSVVLDMAEIPIGTYEYNYGIKRVRVTSKVQEILGLMDEEKEILFSDYALFEKKLAELRCAPVNQREQIFELEGEEKRYIKLESFVRDNNVFGILIDVTKDMNEKKKIRQERDEDIVTGLYSRRAFLTRIGKIFKKEDEMKHAAMLMIDTDNLKEINDYYGHEAGDAYLRKMADILRSGTAPGKIAARLSGDEFAMLIYGCGSRQELQAFIEETAEKQNGEAEETDKNSRMNVRFSMGSAYYPEDSRDYHELLKIADERMYEEKRQRKKAQNHSLLCGR